MSSVSETVDIAPHYSSSLNPSSSHERSTTVTNNIINRPIPSIGNRTALRLDGNTSGYDVTTRATTCEYMPPSSAVVYQDNHQRSFGYDVRRQADAVVDSFRQVQIEDAREASTLGQGRRQTLDSSWKSGYNGRAQDPCQFDRGVINGRQWVSEDTSKFVPGPPESHPFPLQGSYGLAARTADGAHGIMLPRQHQDYHLSGRTYSTAEIGSAHPRKGLYRHDPVSQRLPLQEENIRPVVHPDKFDGGIGWQDYLTHFELCADLNR